jgi:hypothetical protein
MSSKLSGNRLAETPICDDIEGSTHKLTYVEIEAVGQDDGLKFVVSVPSVNYR